MKVLAMAGLFGVLSHVVERRTREIFVCAALVACWLPARPASHVDPNVALRDH